MSDFTPLLIIAGSGLALFTAVYKWAEHSERKTKERQRSLFDNERDGNPEHVAMTGRR
jgi:hypothetical protein